MSEENTRWIDCPDCDGRGVFNVANMVAKGEATILAGAMPWSELVRQGPVKCDLCDGEGCVKELATNQELAEDLL